MDLNRISLIGNVAHEPESKSFESGAAVTKVSLATSHSWKEADTQEVKEKVAFHSVMGWNGLGTTMEKYLKKGDRVYIEGRLDYRSYEGGDGTKKYVTNIIANRMIMLGSAKQKGKEAATEQVVVENTGEHTETLED